jgi:hypothetical protein
MFSPPDSNANGLLIGAYITLDISDYGKVFLKKDADNATQSAELRLAFNAGPAKLVTGSGTVSSTKVYR